LSRRNFAPLAESANAASKASGYLEALLECLIGMKHMGSVPAEVEAKVSGLLARDTSGHMEKPVLA
jgi:hypothetical protein